MLAERRKLFLKALQDPDPGVQATASEGLDSLEALMGMEQIVATLKTGDRGQKVRALLSLERVDSPQVFPPLLAALKSSDADLRGTAIQVLGRKHHPKTLNHLVKHLKDPHPAVRVHTAEALGYFDDVRLIPYLGALVCSDDDALARAAIRSLGRIGAPDGQQHLAKALDDPRPAIRKAGLTALAELQLP